MLRPEDLAPSKTSTTRSKKTSNLGARIKTDVSANSAVSGRSKSRPKVPSEDFTNQINHNSSKKKLGTPTGTSGGLSLVNSVKNPTKKNSYGRIPQSDVNSNKVS